MGTLRKYLLSGSVLTSVLSAVQSLRAQRKAPKDWRTWLGWLAWGLTTAVAIGTVRINSVEETKPESLRKPKTATGPNIIKKGKK